MSADVARWPSLKLETHPVLDWVEITYSKSWLLEISEAVSKNPHPIQTRTATGIPGVWDPAIEMVLRALANNRAALKALNHRRPTPPSRVVALNRAVHFHVQVALDPECKRTAVRADVADAWGVKDAQVKDDVARFLVGNGDPCIRHAAGVLNAPFFVEQIVSAVCHRTTERAPRY